MNIQFSIYFTNHLNDTIKLDNNIVDVEDGILEKKLNQAYNSISFVTNSIYFDNSIIGDGKERILVRIALEDVIKECRFCIESIDYLTNDNTRVYCKSETYKYSKIYLDKDLGGNSVKEILQTLLSDTELIFSDNFTNTPLHFATQAKGKTPLEVLEDLRKNTLFDYYLKDEKLYFEDKKVIQKESVAMKRFSEIDSIIDFSTSKSSDKRRINTITINKKSNDNSNDTGNDTEKNLQDVKSETLLTVDITPDPQPCSPETTVTHTDSDGNTYRISPKIATVTVYYSPQVKKPVGNLQLDFREKTIIETFHLDNEHSITLKGGIVNLLDIKGIQAYPFNGYTLKQYYNTIALDKPMSGEVKIKYTTKILTGTIDASPTPKNIPINYTHFDKKVNKVHQIVDDGSYSPEPTTDAPYEMQLSMINDWGLSIADSTEKDITIEKYNADTKTFDSLEDNGSTTSDDFGDFTLSLASYGTYKLTTDATTDPLYVDYYINKKDVYMDDVDCS